MFEGKSNIFFYVSGSLLCFDNWCLAGCHWQSQEWDIQMKQCKMDPTPKTSLTTYTFNQTCFFGLDVDTWFMAWYFFAFLFPGSPPKWYHGFAFQDSHGRSAAHIAAALRHKEAATHLAELSNCGKDSFGYTVEKILELGSFGNEIPTVQAAKSGEC